MKSIRLFSRVVCLLMAIVLSLSICGCGESKVSQTEVYAMDTIMTLTAYGRNRDAGLNAAQAIIYSMDSMLDPELETSTIYAVNHAQGSAVSISGQIAEMIQKAMTVYERSEGAFDITVYPIVKRWGFVNGEYYVPTDSEIAEDVARLCSDQIMLTSFPATGTYTLQMPSYGEITLGAVAKGCAADNAVEAMRNAGVESGIVSLGGNVQTLGTKPDGSLWNVAIQDPNNTSSYVGVLTVGEKAIVTSGTYQRNFTTLDGKFYHHIIKPKTGYPVTNTLESVTIICDDGTMADCLSTALFVLGKSGAMSYWRSYGQGDDGFEMILITNENQVICTSGLIEQFNLSNQNYTVTYTE